MEEPTDNLSGGQGHSRSGDYYGFPAGTFGQEQEEDQMSSLFNSPEPQSPPPALLWQSLPPVKGFAATENFGDGRQIIPPLDEMLRCNPPAAVAQETNYAAAPPAPLLATHGTEPAG